LFRWQGLAWPSRPAALALEPQRLADPIRVLGQRAVDEVDHRQRFGQTVHFAEIDDS
jgi:hypothetical protein